MNDPFLLVFLISLFGLLLLFINVCLFLKTLKSNYKNKLYKSVLTYLLIYFIIELVCNIIGYLEPKANIFVSHFAFSLQFLFLSLFFYSLFEKMILKKLVVVMFFFFLVTNMSLYFNDGTLFWEFNLFEIVASSFLIIGYTLIHLFNNLGEKKNYFYFTIGVSAYMLTSSVIFLSGNLDLVFIKDPYIDIWIFNSLFFIIYQVLIFKEWSYIKSLQPNE